MSFLTGTIAAIASLLVCILSPVQALAVYIAVLAWYPVTLTLKLGTVDFSASRIVAIVLLISLLMRSASGKFRFIAIDWYIPRNASGSAMKSKYLSSFIYSSLVEIVILTIKYGKARSTMIPARLSINCINDAEVTHPEMIWLTK